MSRNRTAPAGRRGGSKEPFEVGRAMRLLRRAVREYPKAAMFELADEGYGSVFEQVAACIISIRTMEHTTLAASRSLFSKAATPAAVAKLSAEEIDGLIGACTFHFPKARNIRRIAQIALEKHGGALPADREVVLELPGVGPKCCNLAVGISGGRVTGVPVDIHVHRVTNRWGIFPPAGSPEKTMVELEKILPRKYWLEINKLLVPFGKHVCRGVRPRCSTCPLLRMCRQVGVTDAE